MILKRMKRRRLHEASSAWLGQYLAPNCLESKVNGVENVLTERVNLGRTKDFTAVPLKVGLPPGTIIAMTMTG